MFDLFSWSHILILLVVALVVVGPKDLPKLMRTAGQWAGRARAMANEFRRSFDEMARQSELDELRKEIESLRGDRPFADIERDLHSSIIPPEQRSRPEPAATAAEPPIAAPEPAAPEPMIEPQHFEAEATVADPAVVAANAGSRPPAP